MDTAARRRLGDIVVERGHITEAQLQQALVHQSNSGAKLGEVLVELGFISRVALAGVISEQWDELRLTQSRRKVAETQSRKETVPSASPEESALHARVEQLTAELAARDQRIAQQDATIAALLGQLGGAAA